MNDLKQEYLNAKYADYDDESDVPYKRKRKHIHPKKSKHKHEYENVVIVEPDKPDNIHLISRCSVCGKVGYVQKDARIERKFPHVHYDMFCGVRYENGDNHKEEYEDFVKWVKEEYDTVDMKFDDLWRVKYL